MLNLPTTGFTLKAKRRRFTATWTIMVGRWNVFGLFNSCIHLPALSNLLVPPSVIRKSSLRNPRNSCLWNPEFRKPCFWNPESWGFQSGGNSECGIQVSLATIRNPATGIQNPGSGIQSKIVLDSLICGKLQKMLWWCKSPLCNPVRLLFHVITTKELL